MAQMAPALGEWAEAVTIGDLLLRQAAATPEADALVLPTERRTYAQLAAESEAIARGLIALGTQPGDRVGYLMNNSPETVAALFGIALSGAVIVPINTRYRTRELPFILSDARLRTILTSDRSDEYVDLFGLLDESLPGLTGATDARDLRLVGAPELRSIVMLGERRAPGALPAEDFHAGAATVDEAALRERRLGIRVGSVAMLLFTSGTTSQPRACRLTHEALIRNWGSIAAAFRLQPGEGVWAPGPMFHLGAIGPILLSVAAGAALLTDTYFEPGRALAMLDREGPAILFPAYPPITMGMLTHPNFAEADLSPARVILNVGPAEVLRQIQATLPGATLLSMYALTESGGAATLTALEDDLDTRVTTCGRPHPGVQVRIVNPETRAPLPEGETGEICVRGVSICDGYENDPDKNAIAFDPDGWLHTGDRGRLDTDGRVIFLGRLKETIKVGGENVAEVEIESHLSTHPAVKLVQVVGAPDERLDEIPFAFVELRPGAEATEEDIIAHCRDAIASFKLPRHVEFVTEWPMSASKVQKGRLRERAAAVVEVRQPHA
jgi:acyl-CoA synthetase (AMP-forming)/AMP-acid ligase II